MVGHRGQRWHRRTAGAVAGAVLALGVSPLLGAPAAHADGLDDLFFDLFDGVTTSAVSTGDVALDPAGAAFDQALAGAGSWDWLTDFSDQLTASWQQSSDALHTGIEDWINDPANAALEQMLNQPFVDLFGRTLIGDGLDDFTGANTSLLGSTGLFGDLGDGGFLFGDGGAGAAGTADHIAGYAGGLAGLFGTPGADGVDFGGPGAAAAVAGSTALVDTDAGSGLAGSLTDPPAAAAVPPLAALQTAQIPLDIKADTEPVVNISLGGGREIPVLVDTGSRGLVVPWYDIGWQNLGWPTGFGIGAYSGGLTYFYMTLPTTVNFGPDMVTGQDIITTPTSVDAVLFSWPTSWQSFLYNAQVDGVWGVGPNAVGPDNSSIPLVTDALPGDLSKGMLIDQANGVLQFGANPLTDGLSMNGAPNATLYVSIDDGPTRAVNAIIDSGGVYGTMPSSMLTSGQTSGYLPAGTKIEVFANPYDSTPLYSYTTSAANAPTVTTGTTMNTGNLPFALQPMYIGTTGSGETYFGNPGSVLTGTWP